MQKSRAHPPKRASCRGMTEKDKHEDSEERTAEDCGESEKLRHLLRSICKQINTRSPHGITGGLLASGRSPFFPSLILKRYAHLRPLRMSRAHVLSNARDAVISGGTFYTADTVSATLKYPPSKLMALYLLQINIHIGNRTMSDGVIPLTPNPSNRFTGRTEVITRLKCHFSNTNDSALTRKFFLLHGMGGIGKTQICLKFVEEMSDW